MAREAKGIRVGSTDAAYLGSQGPQIRTQAVRPPQPSTPIGRCAACADPGQTKLCIIYACFRLLCEWMLHRSLQRSCNAGCSVSFLILTRTLTITLLLTLTLSLILTLMR